MNPTDNPVHNPDGLTDAQIGTAEGWRLLRVGETVEAGDEFWTTEGEIHPCNGSVGQPVYASSMMPRRTRRPDPLSPPAETAPRLNGWHRFSDAMPTGPFIAGRMTIPPCQVWETSAQFQANAAAQLKHDGHFTHWLLLPEPPREPTQREKDERRLIEWWRGLSIDFAHDHLASDDAVNAWHAALAWERAEVANLLPPIPDDDPDYFPKAAASAAIRAIRARVGGGQ